jgi:pyrimidine operon attenuation protein / uracil phosphoribosyltransferase
MNNIKPPNGSSVDNGRLVLERNGIDRAITRIAYEIIEREPLSPKLAIVGIKTYGENLAKRLRKKILEIDGRETKFGVIDITLYRDDIGMSVSYPVLKGTDLPFEVSGSRIILVDDVLFTGRTIRAALDAIIDFGRPKRVELAVLIDRGHRELPIRADYVGKNLPTQYDDKVLVKFNEKSTEAVDGVYLINNKIPAQK